jgi:hypothetical protein
MIVIFVLLISSLNQPLSKSLQIWVSVAGLGSAAFWYLSATDRPLEFLPTFNSAAAILTGITIMLGIALAAVTPGGLSSPDTITSPKWLVIGCLGAMLLLYTGVNEITDAITKAPYPEHFAREPDPITNVYSIILLGAFSLSGLYGLTVMSGWRGIVPFLQTLF